MQATTITAQPPITLRRHNLHEDRETRPPETSSAKLGAATPNRAKPEGNRVVRCQPRTYISGACQGKLAFAPSSAIHLGTSKARLKQVEPRACSRILERQRPVKIKTASHRTLPFPADSALPCQPPRPRSVRADRGHLAKHRRFARSSDAACKSRHRPRRLENLLCSVPSASSLNRTRAESKAGHIGAESASEGGERG